MIILEIYKVSLYSSLHRFTASWCRLMNAYNGGWMIGVVLSDISVGNPQSTQLAVKVRQFYMLKLQCPCPISLCSESGLNTPILILPNKLNQRTGRRSGGDPVRRTTASPLSLPGDQGTRRRAWLIGLGREVFLTSTRRQRNCREWSQEERWESSGNEANTSAEVHFRALQCIA